MQLSQYDTKEEPADDKMAANVERYVEYLERELKKRGMKEPKLAGVRELIVEKGLCAPEAGPGSETTAKLLGMKVCQGLSEDTIHRLELTQEALADMTVEIRYRQLRYSAKVSALKPKIETLGSVLPCAAALRAMSAKEKPAEIEVDILSSLNGRIKPGTMTLVLGPPSCGKTSFLKALSGRLTAANRGGAELAGSVTYNGVPLYDDARGKSRCFVTSKVAAFVGQIDEHSPSLTVEDTFRFAYAMLSVGDAGPFEPRVVGGRGTMDDDDDDDSRYSVRDVKVGNTLDILGLTHVAKTIVGNAQLRGVSGGQRRRVTVGEMLFGRARVLCGDEITTGLDSKTAFEIVQALAHFTRATNNTTILALLQPAPEIFQAFDDVVLLDAGRLVYHGPTSEILQYFEQSVGYRAPARKDVADFLVEVTTPEGRAYAIRDGVPLSADQFAAHFRNDQLYAAILEGLEEPPRAVAWSEFHTREFTESLAYYVKWNVWRRIREVKGAPSLVRARLIQAVGVGAVVGTLYYDLDYKDYSSKFGLCFTIIIYLALGSLSAIPNLINRRQIFYKHRDASFFPTIAYVLSSLIAEIPVISLEIGLFATLAYWLPGLAPSGFPIFLVLCFLLAFTCTCIFTMLASIAPAGEGEKMAGMGITFCAFFSGFIVRRDRMPAPWKILYWSNPIAYTLRGVVVNEFRSDNYDKTTYQHYIGNMDAHDSDGVFFLKSYGFQHERYWITCAIMFLAGYSLLCIAVQTYALTYFRLDVASSITAADDEDDPNLVEIVNGMAHERGSATVKDELHARLVLRHHNSRVVAETEHIGLTPTNFAFKDIHYTVFLPTKNGKGEPERLKLLSGVSGFAKPGTMTALMGSSGAGKTTLLDVLAGRKTGGIIEGTITLNGHPKRQKTFARVSGYVEQLDVHSPGSTVREATDFSASLRLDKSVSSSERRVFVEKLLEILELTPIADKVVGTIVGGGLSFEQRKRLTMAVELAANPAIMFLDEPTSGLDSRAALVVIRAVSNISATGRSVICTIHQPSYALFSSFDSLLLLKKGGRTVYFGPLGHGCSTLIDHMTTTGESLGYELPPLDVGANPAAWMLDICEQDEADFAKAYEHSFLGNTNKGRVVEAMRPPEGSKPLTFDTEYAVSDFVQYQVLCKRLAVSYWRSPEYNLPRLMVSIFIAAACGSCFTYKVSNQGEAISRVGFFFLSTFNMGVIFCITAIPMMCAERAAFYRERASRMYKVGPYAASFAIIEFPYLIVFSLAFVAVVFAIVGMDASIDKFLWYWVRDLPCTTPLSPKRRATTLATLRSCASSASSSPLCCPTKRPHSRWRRRSFRSSRPSAASRSPRTPSLPFGAFSFGSVRAQC